MSAEEELARYLARIGSKGGAAGRGAGKRRSREHYVALSRAGVAARRKAVAVAVAVKEAPPAMPAGFVGESDIPGPTSAEEGGVWCDRCQRQYAGDKCPRHG
jgi:hypothetical protein